MLVDGVLPAGALSLAEAPAVPVLGLDAPIARALRAALRRGDAVTAAIGAPRLDENPEAADVAPFSSRGLAYDGGAKPDLAAAGVGIATSEPGRGEAGVARYGSISGSSAAAAVAGGTAAVLAQARPDLDAAGLRGALVAGARPLDAEPGAAGTGLVDAGAAAAAELVAEPASIGFPGVVTAKRARARDAHAAECLAPATRRPARRAPVRRAGRDGGGQPASSAAPTRGDAEPSASGSRFDSLPTAPAAVRGLLVARVEGGGRLRIPWVVAIRDTSTAARLRRASEPNRRPTDRSRTLGASIRGGSRRRHGGAASAERGLAARAAALPAKSSRRHAQPAPRRAAGALPVRHHGSRAARPPAPGRDPTSCASSVTRPASGEPTVAIVPFSVP